VVVLAYAYIFIYNLSLVSFSIILSQHILTVFKTIYSFSNYYFSPFFLGSLSLILFSLAGVPPFLGFFSKLLILVLLVHSSFFLFFIFFFILLFFGLYFYLQNLRFLYTSNKTNLSFSFLNTLRFNSTAFLIINFISFILLFGIVLFDDIVIYFY